MDKLIYDSIMYDVIDTINFSGTTHCILNHENTTLFVDKRNNKYYAPIKNLSILSNYDLPLSFVRKEHLLWFLVQFINERSLDDVKEIKKLIGCFKKFIKNSNVEKFLYWPLMNQDEFEKELKKILFELEYQLEQVLVPKLNKDNYIATKLNNI